MEPRQALKLNLRQWDLLIRQARNANVLARLCYLFDSEGILKQIPAQPYAHILSTQTYADRFYISLNLEVACIQEALKELNVPLVLLKGSAYFIAGNIAANGRIFSDVDILVPEDKLLEVEIALIKAGWMTNTIDPYDQKYYRQWMHEIPPLRHLKRQTSIDVHHNILPKTTRFCPDANKLLANIVKIPEKNIWVLSPEDRVLHSAAHLFHEGEFAHGFRDLSDLDLLFKEFSEQENFWVKILQRSKDLNQQVPLYYALRYTHKILHTPIPKNVLTASEQQSPSRIYTKLMDALFLRALMPNHESCNDSWTGLARWLLFVRSHWLKMPVYLMVPHLLRKAFRRVSGKERH
ncbi:MAG: nucleotidyltransferase family protein [Methylococcales bacterium]|nr:nucleotidyltransferase family protein [Methylococcales bacterium]